MKIDFSLPILGLDGEPMKNGGIAPITMRSVAVQALGTPLEQDKERDAMKTVLMYALAARIHQSKEPIDITPEEAADLRNRIAKVFVLEVAGFALGKLNGDS